MSAVVRGTADARAARHGVRLSARLRLTLSYVAFLLLAGLVMSVCVWAVMRFVPNYPLTAANPRDLVVPIASRADILDAVVQACAVATGALLVVGSVGGWWLAGRVLRPLQDLNSAARAAAAGDLSRRVGVHGARRDEFTDLAATFDAMLDRLERDLHAQRRFAANASHELRTPLAVLRALLDVARAEPGAVDLPVLLARMDETTRRAGDLVTALLDLAALDRGPVERRPVALDVLVEDAVEDLLPEARERGVTVDVQVEPATVAGDAVLLARAVDNLLRNAVRHNVPQGGRVAVAVTAGQDVRLQVENDGPPLDARRLAVALEPFARLVASGGPDGSSRARSGPTTSHGLGLPLAQRVVEAHNGVLALAPRAPGGVRATISLPRA